MFRKLPKDNILNTVHDYKAILKFPDELGKICGLTLG